LNTHVRWVVGISGDDADLTELATHLAGAVEITKTDQDGWELSTARFQELDEATAIREAAMELAGMLNGLAAVRVDGVAGPITIGNVRRYRGEGKDLWVFPEPIRLRLRVFAPTILINGVAPQPLSWAPALTLADDDEAVRAVLAFMGIQPATWHNLAAAFEVMQKDGRTGSDAGMRDWGNTTNNEMDRFTRTANSWPVLGVGARHGPRGWEPPANPMNLEEATEFVRRIASLWLDELVRTGTGS
jgi:hypothetical protein